MSDEQQDVSGGESSSDSPLGLGKFIPTLEERGEWQGTLSTFKEYHALTIGLVIGFLGGITGSHELMVALAAFAIGEGTAMGKQLKDIRKEPAYALSGLVIGYGVGILFTMSALGAPLVALSAFYVVLFSL